ncbi:response regulator [Pontibacillus yanchengensis]|uniref:Response regulator n=1 Tax=Pontibacillus yanchengensis TaxID=462910 RepID=A0ACC7VLK9_9BACI|nr:response regulator [Pontibacillus yanchengensis]MYL54864.1 response regulator [Pontibacillus yanchengensis]
MAKSMIKVLLIEDDPMVQEVNKQFIDSVEGFLVIDKASNGKEGIEKVQQLQPDLVLLDIYIPSQDGISVLQQIRSEQLTVDVIAVTAANDKQTIRTILQQGAVDYIMKPFQFERMKHALEQYKRYRTRLEEEGAMNQQSLDELLHNQANQEERISDKQHDLPKGLNEVTLNQIREYISNQQQSQSAEEVAIGIGIARVTARRYLEYLKEVGDIRLSIQYGGVGRPMNRYVRK